MNPILFVLQHSPPDGFYVDVGANHPVRGSMTYRLDREGWKGVCAEPNPQLAELFTGLRNCTVETRVLGDGKVQTFVTEKNSEVSGLATPDTEHADNAAGGRLVKTVRLERALQEHHAPSHITFLTVDVEGADGVVISDSLLEAYTFHFVLIERPCRQTSARLFKFGYLFSQHFFYDSLFVHSSSRTHSERESNNKTYSQLPSRCRSPSTGRWLGRKRLSGPCTSVFGCCEPF
jgi:FkbM family methyltransferase